LSYSFQESKRENIEGNREASTASSAQKRNNRQTKGPKIKELVAVLVLLISKLKEEAMKETQPGVNPKKKAHVQHRSYYYC
jgi:hypothetical protein